MDNCPEHQIVNCPNCGRFINPDGDAFFTRKKPDDETSPVVACCSEKCADDLHWKAAHPDQLRKEVTRPKGIDSIHDYLSYDPDTGIIRWKQVKWARKRNDGIVGGISKDRYWNVRFAGKLYRAHRLAWYMTYGRWPAGEIDHINGNRSDNRLANLRDVSRRENGRNQKIPITNTSGYPGVSKSIRKKRWDAKIFEKGTPIHLGYFDSWFDAVCARKAAEAARGYHPNHGRIEK